LIDQAQRGVRGLGRFPRDYWLLWSSSSGSAVADGMRLATLPLLAASITDSPVAIASLTASATAPWVLLGLPAGAVVDRFERRLVMVVATAVRVAVVGVIATWVAVGAPPFALLLGAAFLLGAADAFGINAGLSMVAGMVPDESDLERANGWLATGFTVSNEFVGPPLGAALFTVAAFAAFGVDAAFLLLAVVAGCAMTAKPTVDSEDDPESMVRAIWSGMTHLWNDQPMRYVTLGLGALALSDAAWFAVLVLYVRSILHGTGGVFGVLLAVGAAGSVVGSLVTDWVAARLGSTRTLMFALLVAAAGQVALGLTSNVMVAGAMSALCALAFTVWNVVGAAFRQRRVPDRLLGRVTGAYLLVGHGAAAVGAIVGGVLANAYGLQAPFFLGAPLLAVAALVLARSTAAAA